MSLTVALSTLGENPKMKTGLTTLFRETVRSALKLFPDISWIVFVSDRTAWEIEHERVKVLERPYGGLGRRLFLEHYVVPTQARDLGADALLTVGTVPLRKCLPTAVQIITIHHLDKRNHGDFVRSMYRRLMLYRTLRVADLAIANSQWTADQLVRLLPDCAERMMVSYEGLQRESFTPHKAAGEEEYLYAKYSLRPAYILLVSNLYPYKQPELLLRGYSLLPENLRTRHPVVVAGGSWFTGRAQLEAEAAALGVRDQLRILGWVDEADLPILYRNADVFSLASREETFGRSVIEAMACGTACVVNDIPVMREVTAGQAIVVDYRDGVSLSRVLRTILEDQTVRFSLRAGGLSRAQMFDFEILVRERVTALRQFSNQSIEMAMSGS